MTDRPTPLGERPVVAGLLALTAVAVVVGLLAGAILLTGTKILGVSGGGGGEAGEATSGETLYLPDPVETTGPDGPLITLDVEDTPPPSGDGDDEGVEETEAERKQRLAKEKAKRDKEREQITLSTGQTAVSGMQRIDLTGTYPAGEGAILQVQRFENGAWANFPVTVSVSGGSFTTYVMTGQVGDTRFRMLDTDSGKASNVVTVKIG